MIYYVYIIKCADGVFYTGSTKNIRNRLKDHKDGLVKSTQHKRPLKLIWYCCFNSDKKAIAFEKYLKVGSGKSFAQKRFI